MIDFDAIAIDPADLADVTDLKSLFPSDNPIELEIGCGKGGFILHRAQARPDRNFLGIEWANKYYKYAADRMARWGMTNVRIMRTDARNFVIYRLADASLSAMHIYHPDPWPKRRQQKHRLIQSAFAAAVVRVLQPNARLAIQTDHAGYFEQIKAVIADRRELIPIAFADEAFGTEGENIMTNFEVKYEREGRAFYRLAFRRE